MPDNTALCIKVHHAVKKVRSTFYYFIAITAKWVICDAHKTQMMIYMCITY